VKGEGEILNKQINMDDVISKFVKDFQGDAAIVTGWVIVAATADASRAAAPLGFTTIAADAMAQHAQLGLLESAANIIRGDQMRDMSHRRRRRKPDPNEPPF
jgi:hypothetical protein